MNYQMLLLSFDNTDKFYWPELCPLCYKYRLICPSLYSNLNSFKMQGLAQNTTIKLGIEHNLTSLKVIEARFDLGQTILSVKENIESRFGSLVAYTQLQLKDTKGQLIANLSEDMRPLGFYGAETGMIIHVHDSNPNSILKQIQSFEGVDKYVMSDQEYDKLPQTFRKWKKNHPQFVAHKPPAVVTNQLDPDYLSELASSISVGSRCKLENGSRGQICYVGKISDKGPGYFVGVRLDEPFGQGNGTFKGVKYFEAENSYGMFVRPNALEIGDFPVLDIDDEL